MSFLSSHRLHWGAHDALTGHFHTHLEVLIHDLPLAHGEVVPASPPASPAGEALSPPAAEPPPRLGLSDIPGP